MNISDDQIEISKSELKAFDFDATESPDLFPPLVALASYCEGISSIKGVSRLIYKESNSANTLKEEFGKMNIKIEIKDDIMSITGGSHRVPELNRMMIIGLQWLLQLLHLVLQEEFLSEILNVLQNHILVSLMISDNSAPWFMNDIRKTDY